MARYVGEAVNLNNQIEVDFVNLADWAHYKQFKGSVRVKKVKHIEVVGFKKFRAPGVTEPIHQELEKDVWEVGIEKPIFDIPAVDVPKNYIVREYGTRRIFPVLKELFDENYKVENAQDVEPKNDKPKEAHPKPAPQPQPKPKKK